MSEVHVPAPAYFVACKKKLQGIRLNADDIAAIAVEDQRVAILIVRQNTKNQSKSKSQTSQTLCVVPSAAPRPFVPITDAGMAKIELSRKEFRQWVDANKEAAAQWRDENRRAYYAQHKDEIKQKVRNWQQKNAEKVKAQQLKWKAANPDKVKALTERWKAANPEKVKAMRVEWSAKNRDKIKVYKAKYKQSKEVRDGS